MSSMTDPLAASHQRFIDAVLAGDVPAIVSLFSESSVLMPPNDTSLFGKVELKEWYEDYFQHFRLVTFCETEREVMTFGDWAVERWAYMVAIVPIKGGERIRDDGRFLTLWNREPDGEWRMSQSIFNSIRPVGSGTSRFLVRMMEDKPRLRKRDSVAE